MGFDVRKEDADALAAWIKAFAVGMQRNLEDVAAAASALGEVDGFTGAAADSSRAYWEEVHAPILKGLDAAARDLYSRYGEYMAVLDGVDAARDAWLEYDALTRAEADFGGLPGDVAGLSSSLATVLEEIPRRHRPLRPERGGPHRGAVRSRLPTPRSPRHHGGRRGLLRRLG